MNPIALQLAKGDPLAPTSWGAFGPGWLWVSPQDTGAAVTINTDAAIVEIQAAVTSVDAGGVVVNTEAGRIGVQAGTTALDLGAAEIDTLAGRIELRAGVTSVTITSEDGIVFYSCDVFAPTVTCEVL